jgi:hypothetical protein
MLWNQKKKCNYDGYYLWYLLKGKKKRGYIDDSPFQKH